MVYLLFLTKNPLSIGERNLVGTAEGSISKSDGGRKEQGLEMAAMAGEAK
jgi:hypothetical protein